MCPLRKLVTQLIDHVGEGSGIKYQYRVGLIRHCRACRETKTAQQCPNRGPSRHVFRAPSHTSFAVYARIYRYCSILTGMKQMVRFRVDFTETCSLGPGKIEMLESIQRTGSLRQAAHALGMSYRRAWLLLDGLNRSFSERASTASIGGQGGGGVTLTPFGLEIIRCYR